MPKPPSSVSFVSNLGVVLAGLTLVGVPRSLYRQFYSPTPIPGADIWRQDSAYMTYLLVGGAVYFLMAVLLLASSLGSLKLKPWARTGMITYAWISIFTTVAWTIISFVYSLPRLNAVLAAQGRSGDGGAKTIGLFYVFVVGLLLLGLAFATMILIVFNRQVAVNAFRGVFPPGSQGLPTPGLAPQAQKR
jgi:hypothetical protein